MKKLCLSSALLVLWVLQLSAQIKYERINAGEIIDSGIALHDKGEFEAAIKLYDLVSRNDSLYAFAQTEKAISLLSLNKLNTAIKVAEDALPLNSDNNYHLYSTMASAYDDLLKPELAIEAYKKAIALAPYFYHSHFNLGITYRRLGRLDEASAELQKAIEYNFYHASSHLQLGYTCIEQGRFVPAFMCFAMFLMMEPGGKRAGEAFTNLCAIADGSIRTDTLVKRSDYAELPEFKELELILFSKVALIKRYKTVAKIDHFLAKQFQVFCEKITLNPSTDDFWMNNYAPFFKNVFAEEKMEPASYLVFANVNDDKIQSWRKKNKDLVQDYAKWGGKTINSIIRLRKVMDAGKLINVNYWYYDNNRISAIGNGTVIGEDELKRSGYWKVFSNIGSLRAEGNYTNDGQRVGLWQWYYADGQPKERAEFLNDSLHGLYEFYHPNGALSYKCTFVNGQKEGNAQTFFASGKISEEAFYRQGHLWGRYITYHKNGKISSESWFKNGDKDSIKTSYDAKGRVMSIENYKAGKLDGLYQTFHSNGKIELSSLYKDDEKVGQWKSYNRNGQLLAISTFINGKREGVSETFFDDGKLQSTGFYKDGEADGESKRFYESGKVEIVAEMKDSRIVKYSCFNGKGEKVYAGEEKNNILEFKLCNEEGTLVTEGLYVDGKKNGTWKNYRTNGTLSNSENYNSDGALHGEYLAYYINGKVKFRCNYENDQFQGLYTSYNPFGNIDMQGWMKDGEQYYDWYYYDLGGKLSSHNYYIGDQSERFQVEYLPNGKKRLESRFRQYLPEEYLSYDSLGNVVGKVALNKGCGQFKRFGLNGKLEREFMYETGVSDGPLFSYFFNGALLSKGFYINNKLDSTYQTFTVDSVKMVDGKYDLGEEVGEWKWYFPSGKLKTKGSYINGMVTGKWESYYENGQIRELENYNDDGELHGETIRYSEDGDVMYKFIYNKANLVAYSYLDISRKFVKPIALERESGKIITFYANGKKSYEVELKNGLKNGPVTQWFNSGKTRLSCMYENNNLTGKVLTYNKTGVLLADENFVMDEKDGICKYFWDSGMVKMTENNCLGKTHGLSSYYNEKGQLVKQESYYYDDLIDLKKIPLKEEAKK
jgi:uncharacterized protein